jgi:hypothetical protein
MFEVMRFTNEGMTIAVVGQEDDDENENTPGAQLMPEKRESPVAAKVKSR